MRLERGTEFGVGREETARWDRGCRWRRTERERDDIVCTEVDGRGARRVYGDKVIRSAAHVQQRSPNDQSRRGDARRGRTRPSRPGRVARESCRFSNQITTRLFGTRCRDARAHEDNTSFSTSPPREPTRPRGNDARARAANRRRGGRLGEG